MRKKDVKIYIAGSSGMVGSALKRQLEASGYTDLISPKSAELNLIAQHACELFFAENRPEIVIVAAARVGGIFANDSFPAEFLYKNLMIASNVIHSSYVSGVKKLIFLGSSCIYPRDAPQPLKEEYLLTSELETTNEAYAIAKIAGIKLCENYFRQYGCNFYAAMPTNLYGVNDNFDELNSHVIAALIRKFHRAKIQTDPEVIVWGTGTPHREFLFVDDMATAILFLMENVEAGDIYTAGISHINVGTGTDLGIGELAEKIKKLVGYEGTIEYNTSKPDGTPRKLLDVSRMSRLGWRSTTTLDEGLQKTYDWYLRSVATAE